MTFFEKRATTPSTFKILQYWTSEEGIKQRREIERQYIKSENQSIYFPSDINSTSCFACNIPSLKSDKDLDKCHITPWCVTLNQHVSNFILMCRMCHKASPTVEDVKYFWKWIACRKKTSEMFQDEVLSFISKSDLMEYHQSLTANHSNPSVCVWFDMIMLERVDKLKKAMSQMAQYLLSSQAVIFAEVITLKRSGIVPSDVFNDEEIESLYRCYQARGDDYLEDISEEEYLKNHFYHQIKKYEMMFQSRIEKYSSSNHNQTGLFDHCYN